MPSKAFQMVGWAYPTSSWKLKFQLSHKCWCDHHYKQLPGGHSITAVETREEPFSCVPEKLFHQEELLPR
uniref:Uncharacterized protein n=1 Tax=Octopus bimaculoides TaxID=37653 RepID=A0A0L8GNA7_OCTBM